MHIVVLMASMLGASQAMAAEGYWTNSAGEVWRNSSGECWHNGFWAPEMAIVGCDGKVAEAAAVVEPPPPAAPAPAPMAPMEARVNFAFDSADLDQTATSAIDTLVTNAKSKGNIKSVKLTGHADRIGTEDYNQDLSLRRASSVSDYLVQNAGVSPQAIEIGGKGESEPLVGCEGVRGAAAIECLAPNRRVDIVFDVF
jgi:OOP family OmpA-OmpF porin